VDDEQPSKDAGGIDPDKIIAWGRPTQETRERRGVIIDINKDSIVFRDEDSDTAIKRLDKIISEQTKVRADTKDGLSDKLVTAHKDLAKRADDVRKMALPHKTKVDPALIRAVEVMKQAAASIDGGKKDAAGTEQSEAIETLTKARDALTVPARYTLLPRTK